MASPVLLGDEDPDKLAQQGHGIIDGPGADLVLYEAIGGAEESHLVRVEVSNDLVEWTDVSATRQVGPHGLPALPSIERFGEFVSAFDISGHGQVARYLRITGTASSAPGQTTNGGNGYDLDAVAFMARPPMTFITNDHPGIGSSGFGWIESAQGGVAASRS